MIHLVVPGLLWPKDSIRDVTQGLELPALCLLYTSDAADERSSVDLGGRRIIKKKKRVETDTSTTLSKEYESS